MFVCHTLEHHKGQKNNPGSGPGPEVDMVIQGLNTRLGTFSNAMGYCSYCNPTQRRKGQCATIAETQEGYKKQLERRNHSGETWASPMEES